MGKTRRCQWVESSSLGNMCFGSRFRHPEPAKAATGGGLGTSLISGQFADMTETRIGRRRDDPLQSEPTLLLTLYTFHGYIHECKREGKVNLRGCSLHQTPLVVDAAGNN